MCSVSISEQEISQIDTATVAIVFTTVAGTVGASVTQITKIVDDHDYAYNVKT
jgi:hypothetical protein